MTLWDRLVENAERRPDRLAVIRGDERMTFSGWRRRALEIAGWLREEGLVAGQRVILWMEPSPEMAAAVFGVWAMGGVAVLIDARVTAEQLRHALATAAPRAVLHDPSRPPPVAAPDGPRVTAVADARARVEPPALAPRKRLGTDPASIVFTSGSTGRPKGVTQSHGSLARGCAAVTGYLGMTAEDSILCAVPWSFDYGFMQLQAAAATGATIIVPEQTHPAAICRAVSEHRPTVLPATPSLFVYLYQGISAFPAIDVSSIRIVTNTGGTVPAPVLTRLLKQLAHARVFLNYGLTESYRTSFLLPELAGTRSASIGRAIPGVEIAILRDDGSPAAVGESGQIVHRGDYLMLGYWNDPEATARALRPDPMAPAGCPNPPLVLFTGDWGHVDAEGLLHYEGRRDRMLKSMGVRVSPGEVESMLYASGLVSEAAVFGREHELLGHEVCAAVVPREGVADPVPGMKDFARRHMTPYMTPRRYLVKAAMPRTTSGKIDLERLRREADAR